MNYLVYKLCCFIVLFLIVSVFNFFIQWYICNRPIVWISAIAPLFNSIHVISI